MYAQEQQEEQQQPAQDQGQQRQQQSVPNQSSSATTPSASVTATVTPALVMTTTTTAAATITTTATTTTAIATMTTTATLTTTAAGSIVGLGRPGYAILIKDEKNNTVRLVQTSAKQMVNRTTTTAMAVGSIANQQHKRQTQVHYVTAAGLSKEAGLELASQIVAFKAQAVAKAVPTVVAVPPVSNTATTTLATTLVSKSTPVKTEATILPKPAPATNMPRIVALATSPKTPSSHPSPSAAGTDQSAAAAAAAAASKRVHDYAAQSSDSMEITKRTKKILVGGGLACASAGKGLRHFSMKVCEKVQRKGVTSYNEVADELVSEFSDPQRSMSPTDQAYDQKNIRRRVYDALNVLMAMNIISKEKKEIRWLGLPTNSAQECENLEVEKTKRIDRIRVKTQHLHELILQQIAFKNLVQRNKQLEKANGMPMANSAIHLPFIIVNTSKKTVIDCSISADKMEYLFSFDNTFEIHDDIEVLKRMGMTHGLELGNCSLDLLDRLKRMVPKSLENYVSDIAEGGGSCRLTSTSIVAGPSGLLTGRSMSILGAGDSSMRGAPSDGSLASVQRMATDDTETVSSDNPTSSMHIATTSDEEEFSDSEMDADDDDDEVGSGTGNVVDVN